MTHRQIWLTWLFVMPAVLLVSVLMYYPMIGTVDREPLLDLVHQPDPEIRRAHELSKDFRRKRVRDRRLELARLDRLRRAPAERAAVFWSRCSSTSACPARALMRSLVLLPWVLPGVVAADPVAVHVRSAARPHQFVLLIRLGLVDHGVAWLADPSTAMAVGDHRSGMEGLPLLLRRLSRRAPER